MGFFSWECKGGGHSIRSRHSTNNTSSWMTQVVVVFADGDRVSGEYDGYGRVGTKLDYEGLEDGKFAMFHRACWELSKFPPFESPSENALDQGFFVGKYDPKEPFSAADLNRLKKRAEKANDKADKLWAALMAEANQAKEKACEHG